MIFQATHIFQCLYCVSSHKSAIDISLAIIWWTFSIRWLGLCRCYAFVYSINQRNLILFYLSSLSVFPILNQESSSVCLSVSPIFALSVKRSLRRTDLLLSSRSRSTLTQTSIDPEIQALFSHPCKQRKLSQLFVLGHLWVFILRWPQVIVLYWRKIFAFPREIRQVKIANDIGRTWIWKALIENVNYFSLCQQSTYYNWSNVCLF